MDNRYKHGMNNTRVMSIFRNIRRRCSDPTSKCYHNYGGRGIKCEWQSFESFYAWFRQQCCFHDMPTDEKGNNVWEVDRPDNNRGNYGWDCVLATKKEQANNRRDNVRLTYKGETLTIAQWSERTGIKAATLYHRYHSRWAVEDILSTPAKQLELIVFNGKRMTLAEIARETGIQRGTLQYRRDNDMSLAEPHREKLITYNGKTQTINEWSRETGIKRGTIEKRLKIGQDPFGPVRGKA